MMFSDIYVTTADLGDAKRIARTIVEEELGACVNIHPIKSVYRWQGNIEEGDEYAISIKTKTDLVDKVTSRVRQLHSYENPCVISFKIESGSRQYLDWIQQETL